MNRSKIICLLFQAPYYIFRIPSIKAAHLELAWELTARNITHNEYNPIHQSAINHVFRCNRALGLAPDHGNYTTTTERVQEQIQIMRFRDRALGLNTRDECLRCKESELASQIRNIDGITLQPDAKAGFDKLKLSRAGVSPVEWPWNHTVVGMYAAPNFPLPELLKRAGLRVDDARTREPGFLRDRKSSTAADIDLIVQMHDNQSNFANAVSFARARTEMLHFAKANLPLPSSASEYTMLHVGNYHRLPAINDGWNYLGLQRPTSENKSGIFQGLPPLSLRCLGIGAIDRMRKLDDLFL